MRQWTRRVFSLKQAYDLVSMAADTQRLTYQILGGMLLNLLSQLKMMIALDKFDEALLETPNVREDMLVDEYELKAPAWLPLLPPQSLQPPSQAASPRLQSPGLRSWRPILRLL